MITVIVRFDTHRRGSRYPSTSFAVVSLAAWRYYIQYYMRQVHIFIQCPIHACARHRTAASSGPLSRCGGCGARYSCWRAQSSSNGGSITRSQSVQRPPFARCVLLAFAISLCQAASLRLPDTARPCSCDERARVFTVIHPSARCSSIRRIDRQRLIIERIGATRTNQHDAHELCGHPGAQSGSAKAIVRRGAGGMGPRVREQLETARIGARCMRRTRSQTVEEVDSFFGVPFPI